jgi:hypothetical protein
MTDGRTSCVRRQATTVTTSIFRRANDTGSRIRFWRTRGLEEADDALLFVPRSRTHLSLDKDTPIFSSSYATVRGHRRGDPGGRWLALSVRAPCGLNARRATGSTRSECQTLPRCSDNAPAGRPSVTVAILATPSPRRLPSTRARTTCAKPSESADGKTNVTGRRLPIGDRIDFLIGTGSAGGNDVIDSLDRRAFALF